MRGQREPKVLKLSKRIAEVAEILGGIDPQKTASEMKAMIEKVSELLSALKDLEKKHVVE